MEAAAVAARGPTADVTPPDTDRARTAPTRNPARKRRRKETAPTNFGRVPEWLAADPSIGGAKIHPSHISHLGWHRGIVWCWVCGVYATRVPINLKGPCDGPTDAGLKALSLLRQGKTPTCKVDWPLPES